MTRRWSIAGQLLAVQLGIIAIVLVGVGAVSLTQAESDFRRTESARVRSVAENLAARALLRQALEAPIPKARQEQAAPVAVAVQELSGVSFVEIVDRDGTVVANTVDPGRIGHPAPVTNPALSGRSSVGDRTADDPPAVVGYVPVIGLGGTGGGHVVGAVTVGQISPTLAEQ